MDLLEADAAVCGTRNSPALVMPVRGLGNSSSLSSNSDHKIISPIRNLDYHEFAGSSSRPL